VSKNENEKKEEKLKQNSADGSQTKSETERKTDGECNCAHNHNHAHGDGDNKHCNRSEDGEAKCECDDDDCEEGCECGDDDCDCADEHNHAHKHTHCDCDCTNEHNEGDEAFKVYEQAFRQLEDALIKADKEIQAEKKRADENEHIARAFRQDLERFKERNKNAEGEMRASINKETALKIIPILDNFDQALAKTTDEQINKGFAMIYQKMQNVLSELGVVEIEANGEMFNPEFHDCITKAQAPSKNEVGQISKIYQKGYKFKDGDGKIIRHAVVEIYE